MRAGYRTKRISVALTAILAAAVFCPAAYGQGITSADVADAVQKGITALKQAPIPQGARQQGNYSTWGTVALQALALLNAGVPANDPTVAKLLEFVQSYPNTFTYTTGLKCQVLAAADPKLYKDAIQAAADALVKSQSDVGTWSYGGGRQAMGRGDNSNTQFGLLGLHEAAKAGATIPPEVWTKSQAHFTNTQLNDGGWAYVFTGNIRIPVGAGKIVTPATGSMTAAGVASLYICGVRLQTGGQKVFRDDGVYPSCGNYLTSLPLAKGLEWLGKNFAVDKNPPQGGHLNYWLYAVERVGMISGLRNLGTHDWYREGATQLVNTKKNWGGSYDDSLALLFLAKGNRPVLVQKVEWGKEPKQWNRNIHDLENLTAFLGDKLGKITTWQTTTLNVPMQELRMSPVLYITGHEFPEFTAAEKAKLRLYTEVGGTLLFEACCGSKAFRDGFQAFAKEIWPEYPCARLRLDHEVYSSLFPIRDDTYELQGINAGCRTSVFYSPNSLSALWELQTIPKTQIKGGPSASSEKAYQIGANIAAYATGKNQLYNKLDVVQLPEGAKPAASNPTEVPRGAVRLARLWHNGDFNADVHCLSNMAAVLRDKAKIDVVAKERQISIVPKAPEDWDANHQPVIYQYPVVFMTGHDAFTMTDEEILGLRQYLERGGTLVADACCGKRTKDGDTNAKDFDNSFRAMVKQVFPNDEFKALDADHPIYTGKVGVPLGECKYRQLLAEKLSSRGTDRPQLEGVTLKGRTAVIYSKYDYSCAFEGDSPFSCFGYIDADGQRLGLNILLYAISY